MKKYFLLVFLFGAIGAQAQSVKDLLYSGKMKNDSNSVVRKGDDLNSKIDTATKKPVEVQKPKTAAPLIAGVDSINRQNGSLDSTRPAVAAVPGLIVDPNTPVEPVPVAAAPAKLSAKITKEYTDSLISGLRSEVLVNKKVKKDTYFFVVDYEIGVDGQVSVVNVSCSPENSFLQQQVNDRISAYPPQLAPVLDSNGNAKKVKRKYSFNVTKE